MDAIQDAAREFELLYPDPDYMARQVHNWAAGKMYKWETLIRSMNYKYDLMTNVNLTETIREKIDESGNEKGQAINALQSKVESGSEAESITSKDTAETNSEDTSGTSHTAGLKDTDTSGKKDVTTSGELVVVGNDKETENTTQNGNVNDAYQGYNSTSHRPVSHTDTDGYSDRTTIGTHNQTDTTTGGEHETTSGGIVEDSTTDTDTSGTKAGKRDVGESGKANDTAKGTVDTRTGSSTDTKGEHAVQKIREYEHITTGDKGNTSRPVQIQEERDIADLDIYSVIASDFVFRFCVMVY